MYFLRIIASLMIMFAFKPAFSNTEWQYVHEELVLDAGVMTTTTTLKFISRTEVVKSSQSVMPSHPAMHMNADGTVDTLPGWTSDWESHGTYKYSKGMLTITFDDETTMELLYKDNALVSLKREYDGSEMVFHSVKR
ncbi:MAG: hypothetical protein IKN88_07015 [Bacteroidales bacterium]|nr:hypothetical protein [Bacteroidales bacterium]